MGDHAAVCAACTVFLFVAAALGQKEKMGPSVRDLNIAEPIIRSTSQRGRFEIDSRGVKRRVPSVDGGDESPALLESVEIEASGAEEGPHHASDRHGHAAYSKKIIRRASSPARLDSTDAVAARTPHSPVLASSTGTVLVVEAPPTLTVSPVVQQFARNMMANPESKGVMELKWKAANVNIALQHQSVTESVNLAPERAKALEKMRLCANMEMAGINLMYAAIGSLHSGTAHDRASREAITRSNLEVSLQNVLDGVECQKIARGEFQTATSSVNAYLQGARKKDGELLTSLRDWFQQHEGCQSDDVTLCPGWTDIDLN